MFMKRECNMSVTSEPFPTPASDYTFSMDFYIQQLNTISSDSLHQWESTSA